MHIQQNIKFNSSLFK